MFALVVRFELKDEQSARAFDGLVCEASRGIIEHEPGTLIYAVHTVHGAPLARVFYELYRDRDAFAEHERQSHVRRFLNERERYLASTRVEFVTPTTEKGLSRYDK